ncbi:MAG: winged helix-turn-helix domain-containing protein [Candidatus Bathyarchaeota archaeon]|nr:winged helix-turn-helix domain-containing protein [Candidatus Bathyarchaeota archaeon]
MVRKNRDKLRLIAAILEAAGSGSPKTRIMHAANLSFKLLEKYLKTALKLNFVKRDRSLYQLTAKGKDFLSQYSSFQLHCRDVQLVMTELETEKAALEKLCSSDTQLGI